MFSNLFSSSISLATVTPSLVIVGAPHDFSMTTLRPRGPRVTFPALARVFRQRAILERADRAVLEDLAVAHGDHLGLDRLLLGGVGDVQAAGGALLLGEALDHDA